tara:strand:- start:1262 stop:1408 length:147 start_codon:yes stop_codon:yes gene_type:complete
MNALEFNEGFSTNENAAVFSQGKKGAAQNLSEMKEKTSLRASVRNRMK